MEPLRYISWPEIRSHNTEENAWVVLKLVQETYPYVLDLASLYSDLPSDRTAVFKKVFSPLYGYDATDAFYNYFCQNTSEAELLSKYRIGAPDTCKSKIVMFDHICLVLPQFTDEAYTWIRDVLGAKLNDTFDEPHKFRGHQFLFQGKNLAGQSSAACLELLEPFHSDSFLHSHLKKFGPTAHHITFKVPNLEEKAALVTKLGYQVVDYIKPGITPFGWRHFFLHPLETPGIVVQLAHITPVKYYNSNCFGFMSDLCKKNFYRMENDALYKRESTVPPVSIEGIHLIFPTEEKATTLFLQILEGNLIRIKSNELLFTWPSCEMHVRVSIRPTEKSRPLEIDIAVPPQHPAQDYISQGKLQNLDISTPFTVSHWSKSKI